MYIIIIIVTLAPSLIGATQGDPAPRSQIRSIHGQFS